MNISTLTLNISVSSLENNGINDIEPEYELNDQTLHSEGEHLSATQMHWFGTFSYRSGVM